VYLKEIFRVAKLEERYLNGEVGKHKAYTPLISSPQPQDTRAGNW